jgi:Mn-dependent DtxR family transcriptional regulator
MAAKIQESGEMYLETILILSKKKNVVRSIDIVEYMGFSKPSVSRAMSKLREDKYIVMDSDGFIALTEKGRALAEKIYGRHTALTEFLVSIGVGEEMAAADACKMEHDISDETFEAMKRHAREHGMG